MPRCLVFIVLGLLAAGCEESHDELRIVVIPKGLTHEHWQSVHRGAERAAADLGRERGLRVRIIWDGPLRERDALAQIRIVDRRVSALVDGIALAPQHSQTMGAPVARAVKQGIPVVVIDSGLERADLIAKYVATNNYNGGVLAAEHLLKVLEADKRPTRNIVLLRYAVGSESTEKREQGFEDRINRAISEQKSGEPPIQWLSKDKYAGATVDSALKEARPLIGQFTSADGSCRIDGLFAPNESSAVGVLNALKNLGQNKKVHLMGFDSSPPLLQAVADGNVDGLILQDPYRMGYLGVWFLVSKIQGDNITADGLEFGTGEYVITKDNVNSPETRALFDPDAQAARPSDGPSPVALRRGVKITRP